MVNMARKACTTWWKWALAILALVLVAFLNVSPIYILLVVIATFTPFELCSLLLTRLEK